MRSLSPVAVMEEAYYSKPALAALPFCNLAQSHTEKKL